MKEHKFTLPVGAVVTIGGEAQAIEVGTVITIRADDNYIDDFARRLESVRYTKEPRVFVVDDPSLGISRAMRDAWQKVIAGALVERADAMAIAEGQDSFMQRALAELPGIGRVEVVKGPQREKAQWKTERNRKYRR